MADLSFDEARVMGLRFGAVEACRNYHRTQCSWRITGIVRTGDGSGSCAVQVRGIDSRSTGGEAWEGASVANNVCNDLCNAYGSYC